jgi:hypothetical protein
MSRLFRGGVVGGLVFAALGGCGDPGAGDEHATGRVQVAVSRGALSFDEISSVLTTVTSPSRNARFSSRPYNTGGTQLSTLIESIPVGDDWEFRGEAYDYTGRARYAGLAAPVTIEADRTAFVLLNLQQIDAPTPYANSAPEIRALSASAIEVQPADRVVLRVTASDADDDSLSYYWASEHGSLSYIWRANEIWTAPLEPGTYPVHVGVTDAQGHGADATVHITVRASAGAGAAQVTVDVNTFPVVQNVYATDSRLAVGESTQLSAGAYDPDRDALQYAWSASCEGSFDAVDAAEPVFTLGALAESPTCTLSVTVRDGRGGEGRGSLVIHTGAPVAVDTGVDSFRLTVDGEAYGPNTCGDWGTCENADGCAFLACQIHGFDELVYRGGSGPATDFARTNLMNGPDPLRVVWNVSEFDPACVPPAVTDIICR